MIDWTSGRCVEDEGQEGRCLPIYEKYPGDHYHLGLLWAFPDGSIYYALQPGTRLRTIAELEAKIATGRIVAFPPEGARVLWFARVVFTVSDINSRVDGESLVAEVLDVQRKMRGEASALAMCRKAVAAYVHAPTNVALSALRAAYAAVPRYERPFLISMDAKDHLVRELVAADSPSEVQSLTERLAEEIAYAWPKGVP